MYSLVPKTNNLFLIFIKKNVIVKLINLTIKKNSLYISPFSVLIEYFFVAYGHADTSKQLHSIPNLRSTW